MIQEPARVRLELKSHPENVALVRATLSGLADAAQFSDEFTADLKTAVSEACNNVALHAYDEPGSMIVEIEARHDGVSATVTDHGRGITRISGGEDRMGLGLAVVSALADRAEFVTPQGGGTQVRMWFARDVALAKAPDDGSSEPSAQARRSRAELSGEIVVWLSPSELIGFVLGRILRSVAATSHFSVSRASDLRAVNDAIADYAEVAADGGLGVAISSSSRRMTVTGGPFFTVPGPPDEETPPPHRVSELAQRRDHLANVVDAISTERLNEHELVHFEFVDASREAD